MRSPEATFDCLTLVRQLDEPLGGVSRLELQRMSFLGCILSLYRKRPASEWGYRYARTGYGTPFSAEVNESIDLLVASGYLIESAGRFRLSESGESFRNAIDLLKTFSGRVEFLDAAAASALAVPPSIISRGLENEPSVSGSVVRLNGANLLEGTALNELYDHFAALSQVYPPGSAGLMAPSVLWLTYLADESLSKRVVSEAKHA